MYKNSLIALLTVVLSAVIFTPVDRFTFGFLSRYSSVTDINGEVHIGVGDVNDGKAHYYSYDSDGKMIKFFVVKSSDGVIRAAFDACDVCFPEKKAIARRVTS